jgi:hypothetical protein
MHQQLWGYKVEEKLYVGLRELKNLNTTGLENRLGRFCRGESPFFLLRNERGFLGCSSRNLDS